MPPFCCHAFLSVASPHFSCSNNRIMFQCMSCISYINIIRISSSLAAIIWSVSSRRLPTSHCYYCLCSHALSMGQTSSPQLLMELLQALLLFDSFCVPYEAMLIHLDVMCISAVILLCILYLNLRNSFLKFISHLYMDLKFFVHMLIL